MVHLERSYLSRIFCQRFGKSPKQYLTDVRIEHAATLLDEGNSVRQAALAVGYSDIAAFSKIFKEKTGVSPLDYKKGR